MNQVRDSETDCAIAGRGVFVVSLDFELHWGVRDRQLANGPYRDNLLGAREAIPRMLELFEEFDVAATWAAVGFLFAASKQELRAYYPESLPMYTRPELSPYNEKIGENEREDPLHYAASILATIQRCPRQEIGTHTFSHFYCLEPGQTREAFRLDLESAVGLAAKRGIQLRSVVFPRNQVNEEYLGTLKEFGITAYRGAEHGWMYKPRRRAQDGVIRRLGRLTDQYFPLCNSRVIPWSELAGPHGLANVRGSMFLRPYSPAMSFVDRLRLRRIKNAVESAAIQGGIFHLWWHPHNFGRYTSENLFFLRRILQTVARCRQQYGLQTMSMSDVAAARMGRELCIPLSSRCR
jgi:peptidoglycan/xylan/chitin deacetylase (PgdA/CDA1 family)